MTDPLEQIRSLVSLHIPQALFLYQSRVANIVADNLAGQASAFMRERYQACPTQFNRNGGPVSIRPNFPTPLLQVGGFKIQCADQTWVRPSLTLVERPRLDHGLLRKHLTLHPHHRQLVESYLSPCLPQNSCIEVDYSPRSLDTGGRQYCCSVGGQRMPRAVRLLLFGQNHCEIDLKGSFYELVRRLGLRHSPDHFPLPDITAFRALLANDPYIQTIESLRPGTIKQLPLRVINSTIGSTFHYLQSVHDGTPGSAVVTLLNQPWLQARALTDQLLPQVRPQYATGQADSTSRLLEQIETQIVQDTFQELTARHPTQSIVWIHDGFLVAPAPPEPLLRQVEAVVLARHHLYFQQPWYRVNLLSTQFTEYVANLRGITNAPALTIARRGLPQVNHKQHTATGLPQTCLAPLEALARVRARREARRPT